MPSFHSGLFIKHFVIKAIFELPVLFFRTILIRKSPNIATSIITLQLSLDNGDLIFLLCSILLMIKCPIPKCLSILGFFIILVIVTFDIRIIFPFKTFIVFFSHHYTLDYFAHLQLLYRPNVVSNHYISCLGFVNRISKSSIIILLHYHFGT